ncbi:hypothetical protein OROMI_011284 [Orobanche minor]
MPTTIFLRLLILSFTLRPLSSKHHHHRRVLHQPFQLQDSSPPSNPPSPSPPSPPKYPFSTFTPDHSPFFPSHPPPPSPPLRASFSSLPADISSLSVPHPSRLNSASTKLTVAAVAAVISAVAVVSLAFFLHLRHRTKNHGPSSIDQCKTERSDNSSAASFNQTLSAPRHIPKLQGPSQTSSEFLYLGTLVSSHAPGGGGVAFSNVRSTSTANYNNAFDSRKTNSPELRPLPPLNTHHGFRQIFRTNISDVVSSKDDENEEFYSPKGSISGRERRGSPSGRAFAAIDVENFNASTSNSLSTYSSLVAGLGLGSPVRSVSSGLSPANILSPRNSIQNITQMGGLLFQKSASPSLRSSSSPENYSRRSEESSSKISTVSSHNTVVPVKMSSTMIPPPEIGGSMFPEPASALSSQVSYSRRSEESSPTNSNVSEHNSESPVRCSIPFKHNTVDIRPPPERQGFVLPEFAFPLPPSSSSPKRHSESSPTSPNVSDHSVDSPERISSPVRPNTTILPSPLEIRGSIFSESATALHLNSPCSKSCLIKIQESAPRILNVSDQKVESLIRISSPVQHNAPTFVLVPSPPPPPPSPPPPQSKVWESPKTPTPPAENPIVPPAMINLLIFPIESTSNDSQTVKKDEEKETKYSSEDVDRSGDSILKPKLKPLHWDKVRASSNREMVWDQLKCSSFKLNEEMIETLFVVNAPKSKPNSDETTRWGDLPKPGQDNGNRVLDPKKARNIAIMLKALHVTVDEVCEGLSEGNADILGTELLESLLKMAPTEEEERKLREYKDESPTKLGAAERFLKAVVEIPYAFKRVDAMLYVSNFDSEVEYLKKSFATLEAACEELRTSRMFLKLLEAVLKTGSRMNVGTNRGDTRAFKLDTVLKLADVKGADGKTTLLHFVVEEIIRTEGACLPSGTHCETTSSTNDDGARCRKLGLQVVSSLGSELSNVKKSAVMDAEVLNCDVSKLSRGIEYVGEIIVVSNGESIKNRFTESMSVFMKLAEEEIFRVRAQERVALSLVKEITEYFHGDSVKEEARPFRIFMVVRDFLVVLDCACKEVGMINERTTVSSKHKFPVPVNPMLQQVSGAFHERESTSSDDVGALFFNV